MTHIVHYSFFLGSKVIDGETTFKAAPQIDCHLSKLLFSVVQPMARWRRRRRPLGTWTKRAEKVEHYVRLEQMVVGGVAMLVEAPATRIGNGSLISRSGSPLMLFRPGTFIQFDRVFVPKDTPLELRLYGSSYGLQVSVLAVVTGAPR